MRSLIVAVWKEKLNVSESIGFVDEFARSFGSGSDWPFDVAIAPSFLAFGEIRRRTQPIGVKTCAQNVLWDAQSGSYIGEITARMLNDVGCDFVIVGHSERRLFFSESDAMVAAKARAAIAAKIVPIVCVGDTAEQKEASETESVIRRQLDAFFSEADLDPHQFMIAYEPVWAISTWRNELALPSGKEVQGLHEHVRQAIADIKGVAFADAVTLLYGGSVNPTNAEDYFKQPDVQGALVGGASKVAESFLATLNGARLGLMARSNV